MTTKLAFTKDSPLNTALVDEATGTVVYEIETERSFLSKTKFMREPSHNRTSTEAAKIKWQRLSSDTIVYRGQEMSRDEFLPIAGRFSRVPVVSGYFWGSAPKLVTNNNRKTLVAELHRTPHILLRGEAFLETDCGLVD